MNRKIKQLLWFMSALAFVAGAFLVETNSMRGLGLMIGGFMLGRFVGGL